MARLSGGVGSHSAHDDANHDSGAQEAALWGLANPISGPINVELLSAFDGEIGGKLMKVADATQLHACLRIGTRYDQWISRRQTEHNLSEDGEVRSILVEIRHRPTTVQGREGFRGTRKRGRPNKTTHLLSLSAARRIAASERNDVSNAILDHLFRCEEELAKANAAKAAELQGRLECEIAAAQAGSDHASDDWTTVGPEQERMAVLEAENRSLRLGIAVRDKIPLVHEAKRRLDTMETELNEILAAKRVADATTSALGGTVDHQPTQGPDMPARDAGDRPGRRTMREHASETPANQAYHTDALRIINELGLGLPSHGPEAYGKMTINAADSLVRLIRRWKRDAMSIVIGCLKANADAAQSMLPLHTITIRALADFPAAWAGHAESTWFQTALSTMDIVGIYERIITAKAAYGGEGYIAMREAMLEILTKAKRANAN